MKTKHIYIYEYRPKNKSLYYLVRYRDNNDEYVQATFANVKKPKEALTRAINWRDKHLPKNRKLNTRLLHIKPLKNKSSNLPAGITYTSSKIKRKYKIYTYRYFLVTAGFDKNKKVIKKRVYVTRERSYTQALREAKQYRKELAHENNKMFYKTKIII